MSHRGNIDHFGMWLESGGLRGPGTFVGASTDYLKVEGETWTGTGGQYHPYCACAVAIGKPVTLHSGPEDHEGMASLLRPSGRGTEQVRAAQLGPFSLRVKFRANG